MYVLSAVQYVHIYLSTHLQLAEWRQSDNKPGLDPANISCIVHILVRLEHIIPSNGTHC